MNLSKYLTRFALIFLFTFIFTKKSFSVEPSEFIQTIVDEASNVLVNSSSKQEKIQKLKLIALKSVDIKGIGRFEYCNRWETNF